MTDYDAVSYVHLVYPDSPVSRLVHRHISEEVRRAQYAAPAAIVIAVIGTGLIGWLFNITLILCAGPVTDDLLAGSAVLKIMVLRMGKGPAFCKPSRHTMASLLIYSLCEVLWALVCSVAIMVVQ